MRRYREVQVCIAEDTWPKAARTLSRLAARADASAEELHEVGVQEIASDFVLPTSMHVMVENLRMNERIKGWLIFALSASGDFWLLRPSDDRIAFRFANQPDRRPDNVERDVVTCRDELADDRGERAKAFARIDPADAQQLNPLGGAGIGSTRHIRQAQRRRLCLMDDGAIALVFRSQ